MTNLFTFNPFYLSNFLKTVKLNKILYYCVHIIAALQVRKMTLIKSMYPFSEIHRKINLFKIHTVEFI